MKTLKKFLAAALVAGILVAPVAASANTTTETPIESPVSEFELAFQNLLVRNQASNPLRVFITNAPGAVQNPRANAANAIALAVAGQLGIDLDQVEVTYAANSVLTHNLFTNVTISVTENPTYTATTDIHFMNFVVPGNAVGSNFTNAWNGGIATTNRERADLETAVAAARAAIQAGNDGVRGAAEIDFDFGWNWTVGGSTDGNFFANNIGNHCSARLTTLLDRYSTDPVTGVANPNLFLTHELYVQNRAINASLMTEQQFGHALFTNTAALDLNRTPIVSNVLQGTGVLNNGYALFTNNNLSSQQTSRFVVFAEGAPIANQSFDFRWSPQGGQGLGFGYDARTNAYTSRFEPVGAFQRAQYELELANFRTRAARFQIEEVLVRDCGVDIASNPNAQDPTNPATTVPGTTAPGTTTGGTNAGSTGGGTNLPQTNTAVVATGLAGVGVTGLGAVAAILKNKKA